VLALNLIRESVPGRAMLEGRTVHVRDLLAEEGAEFPYSREIQRRTGADTRTMLVTPLLREGVSIGAILIRREVVQPFTDKQVQMLETFADQAVIAIENARLFTELEERTRELARSVEELQALSEVGQAVSSSLDLQRVLETVVARAVELSGADGGAVYELDEARGEFRLRATHRMTEELLEVVRRTRMAVERSNPLGEAALTRAPVQWPDILEQPADVGPEPNPILEALRQTGFRAVMAVPLVREERVVGGLVVRRRAPGAFDQDVVDLVQTFANQSVLAIENARLFQELSEKSLQLEIASQHKSQFLANMSHELRTPLNAILGYTELILDDIYGETPAPIRDVLERVQQNGQHLLGLINDVLDLSRIEAGRLTLALDEYSMEQVVQTVYTATEALAAEKGLALSVDIQPDLPVGRGDERRLTQVLLNLVGNAVKFTESGSVGIRASAADGRLVVSVRDTGPGIAEDEQGRIFEEFQQADSSSTRAKGGTGLGLAISRRIVALHGGRLWVESKVGEGSTFSFAVPVRVERQAEMV
jgi:signal transduction histidine kinase